MSLPVGLPINVAPTPSAPIRSSVRVQTIVGQSQVGGSVTLHDECESRIYLAQGPFAADVCIQPFIRHNGRIRALSIAVVEITADAGPRRIVIFAAGWSRRLHDVKQIGKFATNPRSSIILVRYGRYSQSRHELLYFLRCSLRAHR